MLKLTLENSKNAVERCQQPRPKVRFGKDRVYVVFSANNSNVYHVRFDVQNGERLGPCECKASERGLVCYHLVAGCPCNIYRKAQQRRR